MIRDHRPQLTANLIPPHQALSDGVMQIADVRRLSFVQILTKPQTAVPAGPVASVP